MNSNLRPAQVQMRWAVLALAALAILPALARSSAPTAATKVEAEGVQVLPGSKLWIEGTSTMHAWSAVASRVVITFAPAPAAGLDPWVRTGGVEKVEVRVPVAELRSEKEALEKNMRKALLAEKHPQITWRLTSYTLAAGATPDSFTVQAKGALTIAGVEKAIEIDARARREAKGLRLRGTEEVLMSDHGIKPPAMMMGTLRTGNRVTVHFDLLLAETAGVTGVATGSTP